MKLTINKQYYKKMLLKKYKKFCKPGYSMTVTKAARLLANEIGVCEKTIWNFSNNIYSKDLLEKIIDILNLDVKELFIFI